jgi:cytochrome c-type biogenesis protein CcmH/NrfG
MDEVCVGCGVPAVEASSRQYEDTPHALLVSGTALCPTCFRESRDLARLFDRACALHDEGLHERAATVMRQYLRERGDDALGWRLLGEALERAGRVGEAEAALARAQLLGEAPVLPVAGVARRRLRAFLGAALSPAGRRPVPATGRGGGD